MSSDENAQVVVFFSQGSHHHPMRSTPPSWLPPTRVSDMDRCFVRRASARYSNAVPRCTVESNWSEKRWTCVTRMGGYCKPLSPRLAKVQRERESGGGCTSASPTREGVETRIAKTKKEKGLKMTTAGVEPAIS